jgi:alpha-glucosidase
MSLLALPHHDGSQTYVPEQEPVLGSRVSLFVVAPASAGVTSVYARTTPDGDPRFAVAVVDRVVGTDTWWRAEIEVRNPVTRYRFLLAGPRGTRWLTARGVVAHEVTDAADFRLVAWDPPPAWSADAVIYEIFPDRFARSTRAAEAGPAPAWAIPCAWDTPVIGRGPETPYQFYGGDLDGVVEHLDHIAALGADTIYLTPFFPAESNHRYDAAAFDRVDPLLGGDAALGRLAAAVHGRGMRIIGDLTTNHCGQTHPWFTAARAAASAPEREMFYFDGDDYESWLGVKSLPKLNWRSTMLRQRFLDGPDAIVTRWLRPPYDLDGWRVDVANMTGRHRSDDLTHEVARLIRHRMAAVRPDALLLAEHFHDASSDLDDDGWQGTMAYAGFLRPMWTWLRSDDCDLPDFLGMPGGIPRRGGAQAAATMRDFAAAVSWRSLRHSWTILDSHDTPRLRTVVQDRDLVEVALGIQMAYPGAPMVFAGAELGLRGRNGEESRQPMPWHASASWDATTLRYHRDLIALRRGLEPLRRGGLRWAYADADSLAFVRETPADRLLVYARRTAGQPVVLHGVGSTGADNVYGGAAAEVAGEAGLALPGDGPTLQVWRLGRDLSDRKG